MLDAVGCEEGEGGKDGVGLQGGPVGLLLGIA